MASDKYANLPKNAHDWLNSQTQDPTNLKKELQEIIDCYEKDTDDYEAHELSLSDAHTILACLDILSQLEQKPQDHAIIINDIREKLDPHQSILGCACCGEVYAEKMDRLQRSYENPYSDKLCGYSKRISELGILRLTEEERL
jgi:hypothetical protein